MKKLLLIHTLLALVLLPTISNAHENHDNRNNGVYDELDLNGDNYLTRRELVRNEMEFFNYADRNNNNVLTKREAKRAGYPKWKFYEMDRNHNGVVRGAEVRLKTRKIFNDIDRNGDDIITRGEFRRSGIMNKDYSNYGTWNDYNDGYKAGYVDSYYRGDYYYPYYRYPRSSVVFRNYWPSFGFYWRSPIYWKNRGYRYGHRHGYKHGYGHKHKRRIGNGKSIRAELNKRKAR